jgi:hypothetical protein
VKPLILALATFFGLGAYALDSLPDGHWTGEGHGTNAAGISYQYHEDLTVDHNVLTSTLTYGGQQIRYVLTHQFKPGGFVQVGITGFAKDSVLNATGYCGSIWCHVESDDHTFEMTYVFDDKQVYELGSDVQQGTKGWFESALKVK